MNKKVIPTGLDPKHLEKFEDSLNDYMIDMTKKSQGLYNALLEKAAKLQNKEEYDKEIDNFTLKLADSAWTQVHKYQDHELKKRLVKKEEVSMFHKMLKDANSGNVTPEDLNEIEVVCEAEIDA